MADEHFNTRITDERLPIRWPKKEVELGIATFGQASEQIARCHFPLISVFLPKQWRCHYSIFSWRAVNVPPVYSIFSDDGAHRQAAANSAVSGGRR